MCWRQEDRMYTSKPPYCLLNTNSRRWKRQTAIVNLISSFWSPTQPPSTTTSLRSCCGAHVYIRCAMDGDGKQFFLCAESYSFQDWWSPPEQLISLLQQDWVMESDLNSASVACWLRKSSAMMIETTIIIRCPTEAHMRRKPHKFISSSSSPILNGCFAYLPTTLHMLPTLLSM